MNDDQLSPEEQARLSNARVPVVPPDGAEDRTVAALHQRGLLRPRRRSVGLLAMIAAAAVVVAAAWAVLPRSNAGVAPAGPRYVLMLYAGSDPVQGSEEARRREYTEWVRTIASRGVSITGEELAAESRAVGADAATVPSAAGALPRGFFIVSAPDLNAAHQIASTCPHLRYGGRIVIQRIAG